MRKHVLVTSLVLAGTLVLGACSGQNNSNEASQQSGAQQTAAGSSADCTRFAQSVTSNQPGTAASTATAASSAAAGSVTAPSLKTRHPEMAAQPGANAATSASAASAPAKPAAPQLTQEQQKLQKSCYSHLQQLLQNHVNGMTANQPYPYLVPAGNSAAADAKRQRQLDAVSGVVERGVTPGNLIAFAGPSSSETADLVVSAFQNADKDALKGVIVVFIGDQADKARVAKVVKPTAAKYRFVQM